MEAKAQPEFFENVSLGWCCRKQTSAVELLCPNLPLIWKKNQQKLTGSMRTFCLTLTKAIPLARLYFGIRLVSHEPHHPLLYGVRLFKKQIHRSDLYWCLFSLLRAVFLWDAKWQMQCTLLSEDKLSVAQIHVGSCKGCFWICNLLPLSLLDNACLATVLETMWADDCTIWAGVY